MLEIPDPYRLFYRALIMKIIVTSIQLNSQINQENSYTNLSTKNFDLNVIRGRSSDKDYIQYTNYSHPKP